MDLFENPFYLLAATTRDDRRRLMELAEERSLHDDSASWREAIATLVNPRKRLAAEAGWLVGVGPRSIAELQGLLTQNPVSCFNQNHLPPLAAANFLSAGLSRAVGSIEPDSVAGWIVQLGRLFDDVDPDAVLALINSDRVVARFPEVTDVGLIESELAERRMFLRRALKKTLNTLSPQTIVGVMSSTVDLATDKGTVHAPVLIEDLVDVFEVEAQEFLNRETSNIRKLTAQVTTVLESGKDESEVSHLLAELEKVAKNWDVVAQPIQLLARSRGMDHELSRQIAAEIRHLAVEAFNEYGQLAVSQRLTRLQQEIFAEIDAVVEQTAEDSAALTEIAEQQVQMNQQAQAHAEQWRREITYEAEWGLLFKSRFKISPEGVEWKQRQLSLDSIERLRWGATRHSTNGVYTGTNYIIFLGTSNAGLRIEPKTETAFSEIVKRLWKAVGVRLLTEMLEGFKAGRQYRFGSALFDDLGVELERRRFFAANERVRCKWSDLVIGNNPGTFYVSRKKERSVSVDLSYQDDDNVHILEAAMRTFWKDCGDRFSSLLISE